MNKSIFSPPRRGLNARESAIYIGVGLSKFDEWVELKKMPEPRQIDSRMVWDKHELDEYFNQIPHRNSKNNKVNRLDQILLGG